MQNERCLQFVPKFKKHIKVWVSHSPEISWHSALEENHSMEGGSHRLTEGGISLWILRLLPRGGQWATKRATRNRIPIWAQPELRFRKMHQRYVFTEMLQSQIYTSWSFEHLGIIHWQYLSYSDDSMGVHNFAQNGVGKSSEPGPKTPWLIHSLWLVSFPLLQSHWASVYGLKTEFVFQKVTGLYSCKDMILK
jgi:hypothetical protein